MIMTEQATYTLRRAAGGCSHFARVTVASEEDRTHLKDQHGDSSPEWLAAAKAGALYASGELQSDVSITIVAIEGTLADTRADTVFVAAAIATFRLLGDSQHSEQFNGDRWEVVQVGK